MEEYNTLKETLESKVIAYYTDIWKDLRESDYQKWLKNFEENDELKALFLLSKFTYFGHIEIRAMLKALYRDLYQYPVVKKIRKANNDTIDDSFIKNKFNFYRSKTRFLGIGNPSESGVHLLYYFRQENNLPKNLFVNAFELFSHTSTENNKILLEWANEDIEHIVLIDDFCGNGSQAIQYIKDIVQQTKKLKPTCQVDYFVLVANSDGLNNVKKETLVDSSEAIFELDSSFKCFSNESRYFVNEIDGITKDECKALCKKYGKNRCKDAKSELGFNDDELMFSFFHNTPNNTLPIFWTDENGWYPIFNRKIKIYR